MTPFVALMVFILLLALARKRPDGRTYLVVAIGTTLMAAWEYLH